MALDFHIGDKRKDTSFKYSNVSFEEDLHTLLFYQVGLPDDGRFVLFKKLEDYYEDVKYNFSELTRLIDEIKQLKLVFIENVELVPQLDKILVLCEKAKMNSTNIWVFCD